MAYEEAEAQVKKCEDNVIDITNGDSEKEREEKKNVDEDADGRVEKRDEVEVLEAELSMAEISKVSPDKVNDDLDIIDKISRGVREWKRRNSKCINYATKAIVFALYNVYLGFCVYKTWDQPPEWDKGVRSLVLMTAFVYFMILYYVALKRYLVKPALSGFYHLKCVHATMNWKYFPWVVWVMVVSGILVFLVIDSKENRYRLMSFAGLLVIIFLGYVFSAHRRHVIWRQTMWGCLLQFIFGLIVLRWDIGRQFLETFADKVDVFLGYTDYGSHFVFDYLVDGQVTGMPSLPTIFAFKVLPVILFFSFFTSILYYYGIMQAIVLKVGWFLYMTIRTTACESVTASANVFLGLTETPLLIKPFIAIMTKSEIHAVMTGGYATIAGGVMAAYISFGINPTHLLSASVMSAPAALSFAKLFYPETEKSRTSINDIKVEKGAEKNVLEAAVNGVNGAMGIVVNMASNMVAFLAFVSFLDGSISWFGSLLGYDYVNFNWLMGKCFIPVAVLMGVEWKDAELVANLVGLKTLVNEFIAYKKLGDFKRMKLISARSEYIATYALCGFSNISAIGVQMGSLVAIAGNRKSDIATVAVRALIAGSAACFMTACIAGSLI